MLSKAQGLIRDAALIVILEHDSIDSVFIPDEAVTLSKGRPFFSADAFDSSPLMAWGVWSLVINAQPEQCVSMLPELWRQRSFVVTSSLVSGRWSGASGICHLHGSLDLLQCTDSEGCQAVWPVSRSVLAAIKRDPRDNSLTMSSPVPNCPQCGALARPSVMMGDQDAAWNSSEASAAYESLGRRLDDTRGPVAVLEVTGREGCPLVPAVEALAVRLASRDNVVLIRVNCGEGDWNTGDSESTLYMEAYVEDVLSALSGAGQESVSAEAPQELQGSVERKGGNDDQAKKKKKKNEKEKGKKKQKKDKKKDKGKKKKKKDGKKKKSKK